MSILVGPRKDGSYSAADHLYLKSEMDYNNIANSNGRAWFTNKPKILQPGQSGYRNFETTDKWHRKNALEQYAKGLTHPVFKGGHAIAKGIQESMEDYYPDEEKPNPHIAALKVKGPDGREYD